MGRDRETPTCFPEAVARVGPDGLGGTGAEAAAGNVGEEMLAGGGMAGAVADGRGGAFACRLAARSRSCHALRLPSSAS